jgi:hypothetical protein
MRYALGAFVAGELRRHVTSSLPDTMSGHPQLAKRMGPYVRMANYVWLLTAWLQVRSGLMGCGVAACRHAVDSPLVGPPRRRKCPPIVVGRVVQPVHRSGELAELAFVDHADLCRDT